MKTNRYCVDIYDRSLRRRLARGKSEVRLAVSVIRPGDRLPAYGYADYEKLFPLPSPKLRDPGKAEFEVLRMLDTTSITVRRGGTKVPRDDMADIGYWIATEAAEMAAAAHDCGVGASITVHIQVFTPDYLTWWWAVEEEHEGAAGKPLSQEFQEPEVDDDGDDDEQVHGSKRQRDDDDDDEDDDEQVHGSTKRQRAS